jgi:MFS family permease
VIRRDLDAGINGLEWTVNAYTLTFAVFLLTGAALGDRFGRRRMFAVGTAVFTAASAAAALAPSIAALDVARAVQGVGGALVTPLTLTILSAAVPASKRGLALGVWGGISGLAVAFGPLVGGAVVDGISWQWIFWLNVPLGLLLIPLALVQLDESCGPSRLDLRGLVLSGGGLFGIVWGLVRGNEVGWASPQIVGPIVAGLALRAGFLVWELRASAPMLPLRFFRNRTFALANSVSLLMSFGMFGAIFLLAQYFQTVQGYSPLQSGLRFLPWTAMPMIVAPIAGAPLRQDRRLQAAGRRARAAGRRAGVDRRRRDSDHALPGPGRAVRACRHWDGALLRPGRQRRPLGRSTRGRRAGVRRQQRHPRTRRRLRRCGARRDLQQLRWLRQRSAVRRRDADGRVRRRGDRRRRRTARVRNRQTIGPTDERSRAVPRRTRCHESGRVSRRTGHGRSVTLRSQSWWFCTRGRGL